jgi:Fic family protein
MADDDADQLRHSKAESPSLITDPEARADREGLNALRQFDEAIAYIDEFVRPQPRPFRLRPSLIMGLHRAALDGLSSFAGRYRPAGVIIQGSQHKPPEGHLVPGLVEELCDHVNENWARANAIHLASYVMWRLNWIHPFDDGNGRTSRMVAYVVLCARLGYQLPGSYTIPEQIAENKNPYYEALEAADGCWAASRLDLSRLESLMQQMMAAQLNRLLDGAMTVGGKQEARPGKLH